MKYIPIKEQFIKNRAKSEQATANALRNEAMIDYMAMMTNIELPNSEDEVTHNEEQN